MNSFSSTTQTDSIKINNSSNLGPSWNSNLLKRNGQLASLVTELKYHCCVYKLGMLSIQKIVKRQTQFHQQTIVRVRSTRKCHNSDLLLISHQKAFEKINRILLKTKVFIQGYALLDPVDNTKNRKNQQNGDHKNTRSSSKQTKELTVSHKNSSTQTHFTTTSNFELKDNGVESGSENAIKRKCSTFPKVESVECLANAQQQNKRKRDDLDKDKHNNSKHSQWENTTDKEIQRKNSCGRYKTHHDKWESKSWMADGLFHQQSAQNAKLDFKSERRKNIIPFSTDRNKRQGPLECTKGRESFEIKIDTGSCMKNELERTNTSNPEKKVYSDNDEKKKTTTNFKEREHQPHCRTTTSFTHRHNHWTRNNRNETQSYKKHSSSSSFSRLTPYNKDKYCHKKRLIDSNPITTNSLKHHTSNWTNIEKNKEGRIDGIGRKYDRKIIPTTHTLTSNICTNANNNKTNNKVNNNIGISGTTTSTTFCNNKHLKQCSSPSRNNQTRNNIGFRRNEGKVKRVNVYPENDYYQHQHYYKEKVEMDRKSQKTTENHHHSTPSASSLCYENPKDNQILPHPRNSSSNENVLEESKSSSSLLNFTWDFNNEQKQKQDELISENEIIDHYNQNEDKNESKKSDDSISFLRNIELIIQQPPPPLLVLLSSETTFLEDPRLKKGRANVNPIIK